MAVALRAVASAASDSGGSYACAKPAGTQDGDVLIAFQAADFGSLADMGTPTGGATWELVDQASVSDGEIDIYVKVWTKTAGASEPATYSFSKNANADGVVAIAALSGALLSGWQRSSSTSASNTVSTPAVTAEAGDVELRFAVGFPYPGNAARSWSPPSGFTEQADTQANIYTTCTLASRTVTTGGSTGTQNFTCSGQVAPSQGWTVLVTTGSVDAEADLGTVEATADVPEIGVSAGHTLTAGPVEADAGVPEIGVSASSSATAGVTVAAAIPQITVSAGAVTLVHLPQVMAVADVPEPAISNDHVLTLDTVAATVAVPEPSIDAQRQRVIDLPHVPAAVTVPPVVVEVPVLPGDRITGPGQIEWNGFLMGTGTAYRIIELQGWQDLPPIDPGNVPRPSGHGAFPGRPQAAERVINLALQIRALPEDFERLVEDLENVSGVPDTEDELPIVIRVASTPYLVYGQLRARTPGPVNRHYGLGLTQNAALQWVCSDPRRYSLIRHGVTIDVDDPTEIINQGNTSTQPEIRIHGPVENPVLTVEETGHTLAFNLEVEADSRLDIDVKAGTATVGQTSVSGKVVGSVPLTDWVLRPGISTISYTADDGGGNGVDIFWRDAWT